MHGTVQIRTMWTLHILFVSVVLLLTEDAARGQDLEANALMSVKKGLGDPESLSSWRNTSTAASPCDGWVGVACNEASHVVSLNLSRLLTGGGEIDAAIQDLSYLRTLILSDDNLAGNIPPEITRLASLTTLDLSYNQLTGDLPQGWSNLTELQDLSLHHNQLTGQIPPQLSDAGSLKRLRLENNSLSGEIPPELFGRLTSLEDFAIGDNNITGKIPESVGLCGSLRNFSASRNRLSGPLPPTIGSLAWLQRFEASHNNLTGHLAPLLNLNNLTVLDVSYNQFTGQIPETLSSKFNASAFEGNPSLCGEPLTNACSSPTPPPSSRSNKQQRSSEMSTSQNPNLKIVAGVVGGILGAVFLLLLIACVVVRYSKKRANDDIAALNWFDGGIQDARRQARFSAFRASFNKHTYDEIVAYAGHFDTAHVLGRGRFATVYKSVVPDGTVIAVKVFRHSNMPAVFERELETLAFLKHKNLLCIRGFYLNPLEKAILYDYLPMGTVYALLHNQADSCRGRGLADRRRLSSEWSVRHKIALGVAQAMVYLHAKKVIHQDLKSTNILLQEDLVPKVSDFGLASMISGGGGNQVVVVETPGYTAPEVVRNNKYTEKSDVYSYGVVLLELITGRKPVSYAREKEIRSMDWVGSMYKEGKGRGAIDPAMLTSCLWPDYIDKALSLAMWCVDENPNHRPSMAEVSFVLEGLCPVLSPLRSPPPGSAEIRGGGRERPLLNFPS